jgi:Flp pilus assembly protein CpaB
VEAKVAPVTVPALVATRDLAVGETLTARDLRVAHLPLGDRPAMVALEPAAAVGAVLATPVRVGEEVTSGRLVGPDLLAGLPAGSRAVWLPAAGADSLTGIGPGTRVDVHAPGAPVPVLREAVVLARTGPSAASSAGLVGGGSEAAAGLLVAASASDAARVLGADVGEDGVFRFALSGR